MIKLCERCKKEFTVYQSNLDRGKGKFCSRACSDTGKVEATCIVCNKKFFTHECKLKIGKGKTCSRICYHIWRKGQPAWNKGLPAPWLLGNNHRTGKPTSVKQKNSVRHVMLGSKNHKWKGNKVGYRGLHTWVSRQLGRPQLCDHCKDTTKNRYHWANKSGKYLRDVSDWIRLCPKCHKRYDGYGT